MNYGRILNLTTQEKVEGYYVQEPEKGKRFTLHGNPEIKDIITQEIQAVYRVPQGPRMAKSEKIIPLRPQLDLSLRLPTQARPGDIYFITAAHSYLLQPYRPPTAGDAA